MVIYADVLVAVNYFVSYAMLLATARVAGLPLGRRQRVLGSLAGALSALAVFLPVQGFWFGVALRVGSAGAMLWAAWPGRNWRDYLRLGAILLGVSFLFAGGVMGICLLWPRGPISCPGGMPYLHISPVVLLGSVTVCYLLLGLVRRFYRQGRAAGRLCQAEILRGEKRAEVTLMPDSGNGLVEPFSGLPVVVCSLESLRPLFAPEEAVCLGEGAICPELLPAGFRLVGYHAVGGTGLLAAFRPTGLSLWVGGGPLDCTAWVAVNPNPMPGCDGVFHPDLLELRI